MSALLSGPPSDLKKLLLFHVSPTKVEQDVELAPGKTLDTKLPGAKLQSVLAPEGKGVNIKPSSYAGKSVGPAGAGEQLIFFFFFGSATSTATPWASSTARAEILSAVPTGTVDLPKITASRVRSGTNSSIAASTYCKSAAFSPAF
jgi:hypothetical protein